MTPALYEVRNTKQHKGELHRRWFTNEYADLYVWDLHGEVRAFEFCYNKSRDEHVLSWRETSGFSHARIDDGEHNILKKGTPIVTADDSFNPLAIIHLFESSARFIDAVVYRSVLGKLYSMA